MAGRSGIKFEPKVKVSQAAHHRGCITWTAHIVARNADGSLVGEQDFPDISVQALAFFLLSNIFDTATTVPDVTNTNRSISANTAATAPYIVAGTTGTAPAFTNYALGDGTTNTNYHSNGNYAEAATVTATLSSNTCTIAATITNASGSNITYKEVGMAITAGGNYFLVTHDQVNSGTGYVVSNSGTLSITYTGTFS